MTKDDTEWEGRQITLDKDTKQTDLKTKTKNKHKR